VSADYKLRDPKGWCGDPRRGAALGRSHVEGDLKYAGKMALRRVYLNGDYDSLGTYWGGGGGSPIYWYASEDEGQTIEGTVRAKSRADAKAQVRAMYPNARFHN
jgi:hypothetical protein